MKKKEKTTTDKTLLETKIHPLIDALDFSRLKHKLMVSDDSEKWTFDQCETAEREYKRFLTLIKVNPGIEIVPTKQMDKFWHQHILDTSAYQRDCRQVFGYFLHHYPYFGINGKEDQENLSRTFVKTKELYKKTFGIEIDNQEASRCQDHACHVESSCACRVAGACKNHK
jgi:hypothetical protein